MDKAVSPKRKKKLKNHTTFMAHRASAVHSCAKDGRLKGERIQYYSYATRTDVKHFNLSASPRPSKELMDLLKRAAG